MSHERYGVSNDRQLDCLFNNFFRAATTITTAKNIYIYIYGWIFPATCAGNPSVTGEIFKQRASNWLWLDVIMGLNGNIFRVTDTGGFPSQRPLKGSFDVFFDMRLNKRLSKQSRRRWFETPSRSMWRHCNESFTYSSGIIMESTLLMNLSLQFKLFIHFAF